MQYRKRFTIVFLYTIYYSLNIICILYSSLLFNRSKFAKNS